MEVVDEDEVEEMELGELDLEAIEEECGKKGHRYVSCRQIELLQEAIIKMGAHQNLEIEAEAHKGSKRKSTEEEMKRGSKMNKQCIEEVGVNLIQSG